MTTEEQKTKAEDDFEWLAEVCPQMPEIEFLEPTIQAFAVFNGTCNIRLSNEDLMTLALAGFVATRARTTDTERFLHINPFTYIQFAYIAGQSIMLQREINDEDFKAFLDRININKGEEGQD